MHDRICVSNGASNPTNHHQSTVLQRLMSPLANPAGAAVGVDAVHIPTWADILARSGSAVENKIYTDQELKFACGRADRLATRFAAKEAVLKALGTGIRGVGLQDVEVVCRPEGAPEVALHGAARNRHGELHLGPIAVSLCHEEDMAYAVALALPLSGLTEGSP